jgi:hypothetical protein
MHVTVNVGNISLRALLHSG